MILIFLQRIFSEIAALFKWKARKQNKKYAEQGKIFWKNFNGNSKKGKMNFTVKTICNRQRSQTSHKRDGMEVNLFCTPLIAIYYVFSQGFSLVALRFSSSQQTFSSFIFHWFMWAVHKDSFITLPSFTSTVNCYVSVSAS